MERFCSPLRNELPDIDIDVESERRLEIYDDVFAEYGQRCATVAMVETYKSGHAIRDVGAALGISPMEVGSLAKAIPRMRASNIARAFEKIPELKNLNINAPLIKAAIHLAGKLDGLPRNLAMHPCAIALSDIRLRDFAPVQKSASGYPMLQFNKDDVEAIGLLKLDVLGVRMQSAISYSLDEIKRIEGIDLDIDAIAQDDKKTFDLIKSTRTLGVFQIESPGQRELVGKSAPSTFNDLIIGISLFRPGPMKSDMISPFLKTRQGLAKRNFIHEDLEEILDETEGVVVYHEQVIRIIAAITGCSFAEGDEKRRKLGSPEGQQEVCDWFYSRAAARGYSKKVIDHVWEILRSFASFGFCKAHAAAFALPTYQSAWLKTHHTAAFIAGALTHDPGMYPKRLLIDEARQWGIEIAPIDINKSDGTYRVERTEVITRAPYVAPNTASTGEALSLPDARGYAIRASLADIKGISGEEINNIIAGRPYIDLADFVYRSKASTPTIEALVNIGAFDQLLGVGENKINRRDIYFHLEDILKVTGQKRNINSNQLTLELPPTKIEHLGLPDISHQEQLINELQSVGMDLSSHLLTAYSELLNDLKVTKSSEVIHQRSGSFVLVAGIKVALQTPPTKSGRRVMFLTIDDGFGCNDLTFFSDEQEKFGQLIRGASLILARGEVRRTGPRGISLRATHAWSLESVYEEWVKKSALAST
jgi:error-prone DNA polymerase